MILRGNVFSETLGMDTGLAIVAPDGFRAESGKYRVAYLLHGICGDSRTWIDYSMLPVYARGGDTVYVMPEAARSFYTDMKYGFDYFTYVADELPRICGHVFNISAAREDTAILGASMGGYGALKIALSRPERYAFCGAFASACLFLKEGLGEQRKNGMKPEFVERYGRRLIADFVAAFGEGLRWSPEYEITELAKDAAGGDKKPVIYMTCGTEDPFRESHLRFAKEMEPLGFDFTCEEWAAGHDFVFFDESLRRALLRF